MQTDVRGRQLLINRFLSGDLKVTSIAVWSTNKKLLTEFAHPARDWGEVLYASGR